MRWWPHSGVLVRLASSMPRIAKAKSVGLSRTIFALRNKPQRPQHSCTGILSTLLRNWGQSRKVAPTKEALPDATVIPAVRGRPRMANNASARWKRAATMVDGEPSQRHRARDGRCRVKVLARPDGEPSQRHRARDGRCRVKTVEAAGVEPASRDVSEQTSTCVSGQFKSRGCAPGRQGSSSTSPELF